MSLEESVKAVAHIEFAIISPSELRKLSITEITAPETYDPKTPSLSSFELYALAQTPAPVK